MGKTNKGFSLLLVVILAVSSLIMVESASAQSIPKPSIPEFTIKYVTHPYDVPPTYGIDQYTGKTIITEAGYHVANISIEITIRNQPFSLIKLDNTHYADFFYNISYKGHYGTEWSYYAYDRSTEWFFRQSESEYTVISFREIPTEGQIDFQVQAQIGYYTEYHMPWDAYDFTGQTSGWSKTQTITIPEGSISPSASPNPTPTPTVPEFPLLTIPLLLNIMLAAAGLLVYHKKTKGSLVNKV